VAEVKVVFDPARLTEALAPFVEALRQTTDATNRLHQQLVRQQELLEIRKGHKR
jgi:hypothetical protein